ncbi:MAG: cation transporter [Betaproteobacteria bacterium]
MSSSVTLSIVTNTAIAAAKGFGWFVTASPTLFAETIHSLADVANQVLLKVGEVRGGAGPDATHPFGRGQEKFFWALVSAVSVFFIGCGVNVYHGVDALRAGHAVEPFTPLVVGLLVFALVLESFTLVVAMREIGGWQGLRENRTNTTVLAVVLEDAVALLGIALTLIVAGVSYVLGPRPEFDAAVAIAVGVMLGAMAIFLAALNRKLLIDASDPEVNRMAAAFFADHALKAEVSSVVVDDGHSIVFVRVPNPVASGAGPSGATAPASDPAFDSIALADALKRRARAAGTTIDQVYWQRA